MKKTKNTAKKNKNKKTKRKPNSKPSAKSSLYPRLPSSPSDPDVTSLQTLHGLNNPANFVDYKNMGYARDYCHVSAKHAAINNGGRRIHGWAIWQFQGYAQAEFHSIWEDSNGDWFDVTPPKWGTNKILFVEDSSLSITHCPNLGTQELYTDRASLPSNPLWFRGSPTLSTKWTINDNNPSLVRYCKKLGLPNTLMV